MKCPPPPHYTITVIGFRCLLICAALRLSVILLEIKATHVPHVTHGGKDITQFCLAFDAFTNIDWINAPCKSCRKRVWANLRLCQVTLCEAFGTSRKNQKVVHSNFVLCTIEGKWFADD